jgi:hypothetical protein
MDPPDRFTHKGDVDFAYSAAAVAIRYLRPLSASQCRALRTIILLKDHEAVAFAESHARGLIPYCQQYKKLRIERHASLWRCILPVLNEQLYMIWRPPGINHNQSCMITKAVSLWIGEAMALPSLGMPDGSFSLVIDGNTTPEASSKIFDIVLRDTASQFSLDDSYRRGITPFTSWFQ